MDYKNSLNLPRTDFPMKADLITREPQRLAVWEQKRIYEMIQRSREKCERFVLHDGPPFANGDVHIGTALNKILKDIIIKFHTLAGRCTPFVPGWDCHGLPIEFKVTQEMRKTGNVDADPVTIRKACEAYALSQVSIQRAQFKRLGVLGDWDHPYLTLDKGYEAEELRLFADVVEKGFVYRGKKPVYWSIPCRTALAEAEIEYRDHSSQSIYVRFPVIGHLGTYVVIWTTTPWTLPANLGVAYNSTLSYSLIAANGESYIVSTMLLPSVAEKCGWNGYQILRSLDSSELSRLEYKHPFCERHGRFYAGDEFVENSTGTGFVHIAPGHGMEDYNLGLRHGLPIYSPINDEGCLNLTDDLPREAQMPLALIGKSVLEKHGKSEANEAVLHELRTRQALLKQENYHHSYPHCWRSKTPVIFRAMNQWFIRIDHEQFRERAVAAIHSVNWVPDWGQNRIEAAVNSRPDWCISRQRSWGVPIPAFYTADGIGILDAEIIRRAADLIAVHGSNIWFEKGATELWSILRPTEWTGPEPVTKSIDTLDVWIDSGASSRAVTAQLPALRGKTQPFTSDMYLEGSDQHRGWFQSSLLLSLAGNGAPPYREVLTHGFMVDEDRQKISKSRQGQGGYEKPQTAEAYVAKWGADVIRLWVASQDYRNDITVSEKRIEKVGETYRIIRNALRFQLSNLYDFDPSLDRVADENLTGLDRWVLSEFAKTEADAFQAYKRYEFHVVYQKVSQFAAVALSAIYHDIVKDRLYTDPANSGRRRSTQTTLHRLVTGLSQILSPILAFTSDEAWEFIPGVHNLTPHVHLSYWNQSSLIRSEAEQNSWAGLFKIRELVLPELERERQTKAIGKSLDAKVTLTGSHPLLTDAKIHREALRELINVSQLEVHVEPGNGGPTLEILVMKASGQKCERCWHWEEDVGAEPKHPTLCGRCVEAVNIVQVTEGA